MRGLVLAATVALSLTSSGLQAQQSISIEAGYLAAFEDAPCYRELVESERLAP